MALQADQQPINSRAVALLIETNFEVRQFRLALRKEPSPFALGSTDLENIYHTVLESSAQVVFAIADQLPNFTRDTTIRLLQNEDRFGSLIDDQR